MHAILSQIYIFFNVYTFQALKVCKCKKSLLNLRPPHCLQKSARCDPLTLTDWFTTFEGWLLHMWSGWGIDSIWEKHRRSQLWHGPGRQWGEVSHSWEDICWTRPWLPPDQWSSGKQDFFSNNNLLHRETVQCSVPIPYSCGLSLSAW